MLSSHKFAPGFVLIKIHFEYVHTVAEYSHM